jgi:ElaB/YqjD/DUF883 family membrane-anchored ribosome-binding protein
MVNPMISLALLQIALPSAVSERLQSVKQKTDAVVESVTQSPGSLPETAEQAKSGLTRMRNQAVETLNQVKNEATDQVSGYSSLAQEKLTETTTATLNRMTEASGKASASLEGTLQKVTTIKSSVSEATQVAIRSLVSDWLTEHPVVAWIVQHPLLTLLLIVVGIVLLWGLFQAVFRVIEEFWVSILKSPLFLGKTLLGLRAMKSVDLGQPSGAFADADSEQVRQILARLDLIQQKQEKILRELAALRKDE